MIERRYRRSTRIPCRFMEMSVIASAAVSRPRESAEQRAGGGARTRRAYGAQAGGEVDCGVGEPDRLGGRWVARRDRAEGRSVEEEQQRVRPPGRARIGRDRRSGGSDGG